MNPESPPRVHLIRTGDDTRRGIKWHLSRIDAEGVEDRDGVQLDPMKEIGTHSSSIVSENEQRPRYYIL